MGRPIYFRSIRLRSPRPTVSRARLLITWTLFFFTLLSLSTVWWVDRQLSRPLKQWAELQVRNTGQRAITSAIQEILSSEMELTGQEFIRPLPTTAEGTAAWQYDWSKLHRLDAEITWRILQSLNTLVDERIPVPLGELLGVDILAGAGPLLPVRILPAGAISTELHFVFQSVGINQVLHEIAVHVDLDMRVIAPMVSDEFHVTQRIPLSTVVLQGKVPDTFINWGSGSLSEFLDANMMQQIMIP